MSVQAEDKIYNRQMFMEMTDAKTPQLEPGEYCLVAIDIEHFKLFNELYGRSEGDKLLVRISECVQNVQKRWGGISGYLGGDNFGLLMPNKKELIYDLQTQIITEIKRSSNMIGFMPAFGVYVIDDCTLEAVTMYDRATTALSYVIGNYADRICYYNSSMTEEVEEELRLLSDIQRALEAREFIFFAQPQCDISTGRIVGAESLVRWRHNSKGMISPGVFIPVLEKNGFIADLDSYIWEEVCKWLRSWIDKGHKPVPMSINVSRIDIFSMDVPGYLKQLIKKYSLPAKLLKVEITESAYAENDEKIRENVKQLRDAGFLVMMDDFGSGYSSLNMLKSVSVDILKIDMRFLDINENEAEKGMGILESVVNMSRQMGIPIIVEGVETKKQESFLMGMGCRYVQGFYYYKPLATDDFEKLLCNEKNLDFGGLWSNQVEAIHVREFLDTNLFTDTVINNILGPAAFYDIYENKIEITRVNNQYYQLTGSSKSTEVNYNRKFWNHVPADEQPGLLAMFDQAYSDPANGADGYVHYLRTDGKILFIYLKIFFVREREGHKLYYGSLTDMTYLEERNRNKSDAVNDNDSLSEEKIAQLDKYYGSMPCGFVVVRLKLNDEGQAYDYEALYANREIERISGGNLGRLKNLIYRLFDDKIDDVIEKAYNAAYKGDVINYYTYSSTSNRYLHFMFYQYEYGSISCLIRDVTHNHIYEDAVHHIFKSYREAYFVHLQDNYYRMIYPDENHVLESGNYEEAINRHFGSKMISSYDEKNVREFLSLDNLKTVLSDKDTVEYKYKRRFGSADEWCLTSFNVTERVKGEPKTAIMMIRSINELVHDEEKERRRNMVEFLAHSSDGFFVYRAEEDEKILYASSQVIEMFGCKDIKEFRKLVGNSFRGMVHPDDLERVEREILTQVNSSEKREDYIEYRILRKDGEVRWVNDCGHLDDTEEGNHLFYVFISDVTDKMR